MWLILNLPYFDLLNFIKSGMCLGLDVKSLYVVSVETFSQFDYSNRNLVLL